ncbi:MAG: hypothetical protein ACOYNB_12420 [Aquabacterium sp.]|uniref:hypothetical protein n=1 Tax=Aquabacterium sp. TaxID=1872578 RepID=UPI003BE101F1
MKYLRLSSMWSLMGLSALCCPLATWAAPTCTVAHPEKFVEFLPRFLSTKSFALQRTVLPLPMVLWREGVDADGRPLKGPERSYLSAKEYFQWPTLNDYMQSRDLLSRISDQRVQAAVLEVYQDGNDSVVAFHFKPDAGCWKLWRYEVKTSGGARPGT